MQFTRRTALATAAAALAAPAASFTPAHAAAPKLGKQAAGFYRFNIGDFEVTALHDGAVSREVNQSYVTNAPVEEVAKLMESQFMATKPATNHFNTMVINTGSKLILIDAGFNNNGGATTGQMAANMAAAGIDPKQIDMVLVSHFHPDHINGIRSKEGALVYANAELVVPKGDVAFYLDEAKMAAAPEGVRGAGNVAKRVFAPVAKDMRVYDWKQEVAPGITAIQSDGHTPGHTSFVVSSGTKTLLVMGDACNDPRIFARNPEYHLGFDLDKPQAVTSRKRLLDMAAADKMQVSFYHAAFPATGFVAKSGNGFDWFPATYSAV